MIDEPIVHEKTEKRKAQKVISFCEKYITNDTERGKSLFVSFFFIQIRKGFNKMPKLIIQSNNVQDNPACYLCNEVTESSVPFGIFEAESKKTVCQNCAQAYGPHLVIMLRDWCKKYEQEFFGA